MGFFSKTCYHCGKPTIGMNTHCLDCLIHGTKGPSVLDRQIAAEHKAYDEQIGERSAFQEKLRWLEIQDIVRRNESRKTLDDYIYRSSDYRPSEFRSPDFHTSDFVTDWKRAERSKKMFEDIEFQNRMRDILKKNKW